MGKLYKDKSGAYATHIQGRSDLNSVECTFHNDNCVALHTDSHEYLVLSKETLLDLVKLIDEASDLYSPLNGLDRGDFWESSRPL